ncbi:Na+/H+ antiporter NhaA [Chitinophaga rhizophila]|uniref:Na+/H+ antiporter NhaA n=1 Tax=Chitinophaga rhizophila TaxID=2866212 RepID=UPI0037428683
MIICLLSYIATRLKLTALPAQTSWPQMISTGMMAGTGFTMSIFIAILAYPSVESQRISKMALMVACLLAGVTGYLYLKMKKQLINCCSPRPGKGLVPIL